MHERFNTTAHYLMYRAVIDHALLEALAAGPMNDALRRGRSRTAAEALAEYGIVRPVDLRAVR